MEAFSSFQSLSSVAVWPVLMMNWRSIVAYFPAVGRFIDGLNVDVLMQMVFGTRLGLSGLGILTSLALAHFAYSAYLALRNIALTTCYTKCAISEHSSMHDQLLEWIMRNPKFQSVSTGEIVMKFDEDIEIPDDEEDIDVSRMMNEIAPGVRPDINKIRFWHKGSYFWMHERKDKILGYHGKDSPDNYADIYCFNWSRSIEPLRQLLLDILKEDARMNCDNTKIYTVDKSDHRVDWEFSKSRRRRPLKTVILDQQQKDMMAEDVRSFLTKSGVTWYHEKGLPHRLGYLFHGPPGTGKSSLAFSLASHFGLPVYVLNLSTPGLSDDEVDNLFSQLPARSVVLLEDVDATQPLSRDLPGSEDDDDSNDVLTPDSSGSDDEDDERASRGRRGKDQKSKQRRSAVTLSGLLNAIDGVAATEGRILIQTTNNIEDLDEALIRTGRADRIITFTNATREQARNMFINAYTGTRWGQHMTREARAKHPEIEDWTDEDIEKLSREFSERIHDMRFSPALIQQYFKDFRAEPRRAVKELNEWMENPRGYRKPILSYTSNGSAGKVKEEVKKEA